MGYSLEFYALRWDLLRTWLTAMSRGDVGAGAPASWYEFVTPENLAIWSEAVNEVSMAILRGEESAVESVEISDLGALAFAATVRHLGRPLGSLDHASASGELFREKFLGENAAIAFTEPALKNNLTERPLFRLRSREFPSWGGLQEAEIRDLLQRFEPVRIRDNSIAIWSEQLFALLMEASHQASDLVTLYI